MEHDIRQVSVSREYFDKYWPLPFSEVIRAAESGTDDLRIDSQFVGGRAILRQGDPRSWGPDKTILLYQGW